MTDDYLPIRKQVIETRTICLNKPRGISLAFRLGLTALIIIIFDEEERCPEEDFQPVSWRQDDYSS